MVVYRKKVSKRRRKRTGSKRKITKPRNKRMNRSRQMGGAGAAPVPAPGGAAPVPAPGGAALSPVSQVAQEAARIPVAERRPFTKLDHRTDMDARRVAARILAEDRSNQAKVTEYADSISNTLGEAVANQKGLCDNIKGAIGNLISRVKKCKDSNTPIDLTELINILNTILISVVQLNGQCDGLGTLLMELERRLIEADCLKADTSTAQNLKFLQRIGHIDQSAQAAAAAVPAAPQPPPAPAPPQ